MNEILLPSHAETALRRLESAGFEAYAVGGCVRDSLLGRTPNDWDLTTNARPEETVACFAGQYRVIETGIRHGTVTVLIDGQPVEITTYRQDGTYADNRHPVSVTFSKTVTDDLSRRDFTVNAMAYHPERGLVDPFGGQSDLQKGRIVCVGVPKERFAEDGLRILRAIRFASVLGFEIEEQTARAVREMRGLLDNIARERVREEFDKLILGRGAVEILRAFDGVILQFLPELAPAVGFPQDTKYHCYDVWEHILHALEYAPEDRNVRLAVLFHDIGKPHCRTHDENGDHFFGHAVVSRDLTDAILTRLRYDRATREEILTLVSLHDTPLVCDEKHIKRLLRKYPEETILRLLEVKKCDILAHAPDYRTRPEDYEKVPRLLEEIREKDACFSLRTLAVTGDDLIRAGIPEGKQIGQTLNRLLDAVMDGSLPNEREALLHSLKQK